MTVPRPSRDRLLTLVIVTAAVLTLALLFGAAARSFISTEARVLLLPNGWLYLRNHVHRPPPLAVAGTLRLISELIIALVLALFVPRSPRWGRLLQFGGVLLVAGIASNYSEVALIGGATDFVGTTAVNRGQLFSLGDLAVFTGYAAIALGILGFVAAGRPSPARPSTEHSDKGSPSTP